MAPRHVPPRVPLKDSTQQVVANARHLLLAQLRPQSLLAPVQAELRACRFYAAPGSLADVNEFNRFGNRG
eukprot:scaffold96069_cov72-Phaeocystis_antarctica.AAC.5